MTRAAGALEPGARPARGLPARVDPMVLVGVAAAALVGAAAVSLFVGARTVEPAVVWSTLQSLLGGGAAPETMDESVVAARIPRTLTAVLVGAALAVAGAGLQGATRNPLGDPALLGLTGGAALGVVLGLALVPSAGAGSMAAFAVLGALSAGSCVGIAGRLGGYSDTGLVLAGAAVTAGCTATTSALVLALPGVLDRFRFWSLGSVARAQTPELLVAAPLVVAGVVAVLAGTRALDAIALGDDLARGLGASPGGGRAIVLAGVVVLSGVATALAGPIAFLGLFVPHLLRRVVGPGHRMLVVLSALAGATLLLLADTLGRVVAPPGEIAVGMVTVAVGAPLVLILLRTGQLTREGSVR